MIKNYILLIALLISTVSFGQVLAENFDYGMTGGDLTTASSGVWVQHSGSSSPVAYVAAPTSLTMTDYPSSGVGGHATFSGSSQDINRAFTDITTGTVYASALVNLSAVGSGNYFMHFNNGGFRARVGAQDDGNGDILFGIGTSSSSLTYGTTAFSLNTTYLLVFSYEITTGVSNLHVLTAVTATEPTTPEATNTGSTGTAINSIAFRQSSNIPAVAIDGLRIATNWNEIMNNVTLSTNDFQLSNNSISLYPNPTINELNIKSNREIKHISIYDISGRFIKESNIMGTKKDINISTEALSTGTYFVKIKTTQGEITKKITKN